jgi:NAD(P)-dependent dehydrogenase (short-subunit alcohol dehydrogenase family)
MFDLSGKVAFIAGGAGYLGLPVCKGLLAQGAKLTIADFNRDKLEEAVSELQQSYSQDNILSIHFNISEEDSIKSSVSKAVEHFGSLSIAINATTGAIGKRVEDLSGEEFDYANHINITSSFLFARTAASMMHHGGSIIMYSSMYGMIAPNPNDYPSTLLPNPVEYGAGKAALIQMVRYLAAHYGPQNIRVNAISPGAFPWKSLHKDNPELIENLSRKSMLGRIGRREETAGTAVFLASDDASFITGQVLVVDGGIVSW